MKKNKMLSNLMQQVERMIDVRKGIPDSRHGNGCMHPATILLEGKQETVDKHCWGIYCRECVFSKGNLNKLKDDLNELEDLISILNT